MTRSGSMPSGSSRLNTIEDIPSTVISTDSEMLCLDDSILLMDSGMFTIVADTIRNSNSDDRSSVVVLLTNISPLITIISEPRSTTPSDPEPISTAPYP